jgi:L-asparaginase II
MLAKLGLTPDALQCGCPLTGDDEESARITLGLVERTPLQCDCSGKHTGMLATIVHEGLSQADYLDPQHPLQQRILGIMAEVMRVPVDEIVMGTDGCSLPTFAAPVRAFATAYASLAAPEQVPAGAGRKHAVALNRLRDAMTAYPVNVSGEGNLVASIMEVSEGRVAAKTGAEGLLCLAVPERGLGIAIRIADGTFRTHAVAVASTLEQLGILDDTQRQEILARHNPELRNHNGRLVGEIQPVFKLESPVAVA